MKKVSVQLTAKRQHQPVGKLNNLNAIFVEIAILRNIICPITWTCTPVTDPLNVNTVPRLLLNLQFFVCIAKHIFHPLLNAITVQRCLPKNVIEIDTWEHTRATTYGPYECEHCNKGFAHSRGLRQHRGTHFEPKFECPFCQEKFSRSSYCKIHWSGDKNGHIACKLRQEQPVNK